MKNFLFLFSHFKVDIPLSKHIPFLLSVFILYSHAFTSAVEEESCVLSGIRRIKGDAGAVLFSQDKGPTQKSSLGMCNTISLSHSYI